MPLELEIYNHVEHLVSEELQNKLITSAQHAYSDYLAIPWGTDPNRSKDELTHVECSLVDDQMITKIHDEFFNDPTATDVITFPPGQGGSQGEVIISVETTRRQATEHNEPWERELFRYLIHGMLHLRGYLDSTEAQRTSMFEHQEHFVTKYWR